MDDRRRNWVDRTKPLLRISNRAEVFLLLHLGVSPISLVKPGNVLVLETVGRRSGHKRSAPVAYWLTDDGTIVIGGGAAGMTTDPDWVKNLRAHPRASAWIRRSKVVVEASELTGADRAQAQAQAAAIWKMVPTYEQRAGRPVPYFRLATA